MRVCYDHSFEYKFVSFSSTASNRLHLVWKDRLASTVPFRNSVLLRTVEASTVAMIMKSWEGTRASR